MKFIYYDDLTRLPIYIADPAFSGFVTVGTEIDGVIALQMPEGISDSEAISTTFLSANNTIKTLPEKPSSYHKFDANTETWVLEQAMLDNAAAIKKNDIKLKRKLLELSNINYDSKNLQANEEAIKNLNGKLQELYARDANARPMQQSEMVWRDADNTVHQWNSQTIYKQWLQNFTIEIAARGTALYQRAWIKKAEIDTIITNPALTNEQKLTELLNYDIETGWNI